MRIEWIFVDSWTIAVMKLIPNEEIIDWTKLLDVLCRGHWYIKYFKEWKHKRNIKKTRNGNIEWEIQLYEWLYYVGDPCYIVKEDLWRSFIVDFLCDNNSKTSPLMLKNRKLYDVNIIDSMWWDWDYVLSINKIK